MVLIVSVKVSAVVVNEVKRVEEGNGYNALTDLFESMIEAGIVYSTKVIRSALQNAVSVADIPAPIDSDVGAAGMM